MTANFKNNVAKAISYLYILLFTYAAVSKVLDFQNFEVQLGQSPLISAFGEYVAYAVPIVELLLVCLLFVPKLRITALFGSFILMVMFTAYIFLILNYSSFVPCSCGGILEKLSWKQHLVFNLVFVFLAIVAIVIESQKNDGSISNRKIIMYFGGGSFGGIAVMVVLFLFSENIIHYHNRLIRRFPHFPAVKQNDTDLLLNSYYLAGVNDSGIYLGNITAPLLLTVFDKALKNSARHLITLDKTFPFQDLQIRIRGQDIFVTDGSVPCYFKGKINNWSAHFAKKGKDYFSASAPIDSNQMALRTHSTTTGESILGIVKLNDDLSAKLNTNILQKQHDKVFDTDGHLLYSTKIKRLVYLYAYRNQYSISDNNLNLISRGNTIDTNTQAKLKIAPVKSRNQLVIARPPLYVNIAASVYKNLLFVRSSIPGQHENDELWKTASIIDIYNLTDNSYVFSFYIYDEEGHKMKSFEVKSDMLYALIGNHLVSYKLRSSITKNYIPD